LLHLQAFAARIGEANDRVVAELGQSFPSVRFDISETPAFATIGLDLKVKAVAVEKLVGAVFGLGRTASGVGEWSSGARHKGIPFYRTDLSPKIYP
jgi:hypothetical protein